MSELQDLTELSTREKILETAEDLFARRGYQGVGLREVARLTELSKSALFHHFPSKLELYTAVVGRILSEIELAVAQPGAPDDAPLEALRHRVEALIDVLATSPTRAPLLLRTLFESDILDLEQVEEFDLPIENVLAVFTKLLTAGVEAGDIRPIPVPHAIQSLIGMIVFHFASGELGDEILGDPVYSAEQIRRFKEYVVSLLERGLMASPSHQGD